MSKGVSQSKRSSHSNSCVLSYLHVVLWENKGLWSHRLLVEWEVSLKEQVFQFYGGKKRKREERYLKRGGKKKSLSLVEHKYPILLMYALFHVGLLCDHSRSRLKQCEGGHIVFGQASCHRPTYLCLLQVSPHCSILPPDGELAD